VTAALALVAAAPALPDTSLAASATRAGPLLTAARSATAAAGVALPTATPGAVPAAASGALRTAALVPTPAAPPATSGAFAEHAPLASRSLLLDVTLAGQRLVAVGERGHVLLSDDHGQTWGQAESVPTRALLTGVCFSNPMQGVAVGHDEVILTTRDGGRTWALAHFAPESQQPLLDVTCGADGRVIAVGAYGVYFSSRDGGATWGQKKFAPLAAKPAAGRMVAGSGTGGGPGGGPAPHAASGHVADAAGRQLATDGVGPGPATDAASGDSAADDTGRDFHLNKIAAASPNTLYIAAEAGHLYRTDDGGLTWHELPSPYDGSFFGVKPLRGNVVLAYGLRGNLFRSEDAGETWRKVETGTHAMLNGAVSLGTNDDAIAVVGLSGVVLVSRDGGKSFALMQQEDRKGLSAAMAVGGDTLVAVGEGGGRRINIAPVAAMGRGAIGR
jgi:photosystem II stability/assembly factor-like uncharacterized protein